jgi:flavin reductase (DIM6/NTAB) family NADH-FMN oxidoreductase RutF
MQITLDELAPHDRHRWLTPLIAPRPIAFVSSLSAAGVGNLAPFSFFAMGGQNPQSVAFCPVADRDGNPKDTLRNVRETGEFVINVVTHGMATKVNQASAPYPFDVDEFDAVGFTRTPSSVVRPPRVAESPASIECRVFQIVPHGNGPQHGTWVIGEALVLHVDDSVLGEDGLPDTAKVEPAARMGRHEWAWVSAQNMFTLVRPMTVPGGRRTLGG